MGLSLKHDVRLNDIYQLSSYLLVNSLLQVVNAA
jgi:hypothetical protein